VLDRGGDAVKQHLQVPSQQIGKGGGVAAVRHMQHVDACHQFEQLAAEMRRGSDPDEPMVTLPGLAFA
jgi:hypothetical protein